MPTLTTNCPDQDNDRDDVRDDDDNDDDSGDVCTMYNLAEDLGAKLNYLGCCAFGYFFPD